MNKKKWQGRTSAEGVREISAEEDVWDYVGGYNWRLERMTTRRTS